MTTTTTTDFEAVLDALRGNDRFLVVTHENPDGDALGSMLGVGLTPEIAEALYVGLVTDTGRFQYANTSPKALRLAAELVEAGADVHGIFRNVYETVQIAKLKLLGRALDRAQVYEGGRLVVSSLLRGAFAAVGAGEPVSARVIDHLRPAEGVQAGALTRAAP